jgi:hypothetical protein
VQLDAVGQADAVSVLRCESEVVVNRLKRPLVGIASLYLLFGLIGRFVEGMGAVQCECASDCWCKRPALSLFRWVFPYGHRCGEACEPRVVNAA